MSQMIPAWTTNLPESLNNDEDLAILRKSVKQWSQLVSWSWHENIFAFAKNEDEHKHSQEGELKSFFIETVKKQGQHAGAYTSYGSIESKKEAKTLGKDYKNLLLGRNDQIDKLKDKGIKVTLSEVLEKLTKEKYVITEEPEMAEKFTFQVAIDTYIGSIEETAEGEYIAYMAYPPRPATVSDKQLEEWVSPNTGKGYLPPSPYIPIAGSCC